MFAATVPENRICRAPQAQVGGPREGKAAGLLQASGLLLATQETCCHPAEEAGQYDVQSVLGNR